MRSLQEALALMGLVWQLTVDWRGWRVKPALMPVHFGASGRPDAYGDRSGLLVLLGTTLFFYAVFTALSFFPQLYNYPVAVTDENRERIQGIAVAMMGWLKAELTWCLAYVAWVSVQVALGGSNGLGSAFAVVTVLAIGGTLGVAIVQMRRAA